MFEDAATDRVDVSDSVSHDVSSSSKGTPQSGQLASRFIAARERDHEDSARGPLMAHALLADAIDVRATDIHIEPCTDHYRIRFRVDGSLLGVAAGSSDECQKLVNQFRVLTKVDPSDVGQSESRWSGKIEDGRIDVRCTFVPTVSGDVLCIRLLALSRGKLTLHQLIPDERHRSELDSWMNASSGMLVVVGPTGSGKTSLLHAVAGELDGPNTSLVTLEDPVEHLTDEMIQIDLNDHASHMSFAEAVKISLRLDPDYLMVGEMRDLDASAAAVAAAHSGRTILSTMHGSDVGSVIDNLRCWGLKDQEIARSLRMVVATRLLRVLCDKCKQTKSVTDEDRHWLSSQGFETWQESPQPVGCDHCHQTGYTGRTLLTRIWQLKHEDTDRILAGDYGEKIAPQTSSLPEQAIELVREGHTSIAEVRSASLPDRRF